MDAAGHPDLLEDIDFDDLTSPQLTQVQRQILEFTEARHVDLDIEKMLAEADRPVWRGTPIWTTPTASLTA